jgi:hypothetical protein
MVLLYVMPEACRQPGPQRHQATFAELSLANEQRVALEIDISQRQPDRFANAQTEAVQKSKDHLVGLRSVRRTRAVWKRPNQFQEAFGIVEVEEICNAFSGITASRSLYRIAYDKSLQYSPFKEPMEHAEEMIVTARPGSWPRLKEGFDQDAVD